MRVGILPFLILFLIVVFESSSVSQTLTEKCAYEIAEAYQMNGVSEAVTGMVSEGVGKAIAGKVRALTVEVFSTVEQEYSKNAKVNDRLVKSYPLPAMDQIKEREFKKNEIKRLLKEKLMKELPLIAKKVLYEKLFLGELGEVGSQVKETVSKIVQELNVSFNDRADKLIDQWYDKAIAEIDEYLKYQTGPIAIDLTDVRGTLDKAIRLENIEWSLKRAMSEAVGESTATALKARIKDVLGSKLPPEIVNYLDYGPEKFALYAAKVEEYLPGKKVEEIKNKLLHTPLFVMPNGIYCGILAASAAKHFAAAYKGPVVDPYELKRGIEVSKVMIWQAKNRKGLSVDLAGLLDAIKTLSDVLGVSLSDLGDIGRRMESVKDSFRKLEEGLTSLDNLIVQNIDKVKDSIDKIVNEIKNTLTEIQDNLFRPAIDAYKRANDFVDETRDRVLDAIPENFHGVPGSWENFKDQFEIDPEIFGEPGELSPWDVMQRFAEKNGLKGAYEKFKKDILMTAADINEAVSGALATAGAEVIDAFGFDDRRARATNVEYVPCENPPAENATDPVFLHNGEFYHQMIDLFIPGEGLHYEFKRTYRSRANFKAVIGYNWSHNYEEYILPLGDRLIYVDSEGKSYVLSKGKCKQLNCFKTDVSGVGYVTETADLENRYVLENSVGVKTCFNPAGLMVLKKKEGGGQLKFIYDQKNLLEKVIDSRGREIDYNYDERGLLTDVRDSSGRSIVLQYNDYDDLIAVTGPKTFDFPKGKTTQYEYSSGYYEDGKLSHNLTLIMDPNGSIYVRNKYGDEAGDSDMVVSQQYGEAGGRMYINYKRTKPAYILRFVGKGYNDEVDEVTVTDRRGVMRFYRHNAFGNLVKEEYVDEQGVRRLKNIYKYDERGKKVATIFPSGRVDAVKDEEVFAPRLGKSPSQRMYYKYDELGNVIVSTDPYGNATSYVVNALNEVVKEISPEPYRYSKRYYFDANDNLTEMRLGDSADGDGAGERELIYKYEYDRMDNLITKMEPVAFGQFLTTKYEYDPEGRLIREVFPEGNETKYVYNAAGFLIQIVRGAGNKDEQVFNFEYDQDGNKVSERNAMGALTRYEYDKSGNLSKIIDPLENSLELERDVSGNISRQCRYNSEGKLMAETQYEYKGGHVAAVKKILWKDARKKSMPVAETLTYDGSGRMIGYKDARGGEYSYTYDDYGAVAKATYPRGVGITYKYDKRGLVTSRIEDAVDYASSETKFSYDELGRLVEIIDPTGGKNTFAHDSRGNIVEMTDSGGGVVKYAYDAAGRRIESRQLLGEGKWVVTKYDWDGNGRLAKITDSKGNATAFSYDALDRLVLERFPDGSEKRYVYDAADNIIQIRDANGNLIAQEFDVRGKIVKRKISRADGVGGTTEQRFSYDGMGRLLQAFDNNNPEDIADDAMGTYVYDSLSRVVAESQSGRVLLKNFDKNGDVNIIKYPSGGPVYYTYTEFENPHEVFFGGLKISSIAYDSHGWPKQYEFASGVTIDNQYDTVGKNISREEKRGDELLFAVKYGYDATGRLSAKTDNSGNKTLYSYDTLGRLIRADGSGGLFVWEMDAVGNIVGYKKDGALANKKYNNLNQVAGDGYDYDKNGNLVSDGQFKYVYDGLNRLIEANDGAGKIIGKFKYDAFGRMVSLKNDKYPSGRSYVYDGWNLIAEYDANKAAKSYVYADQAGLPLAMIDHSGGGDVYYYHRDYERSVAAVSDAAGNIFERYEYSPYGEVYDMPNWQPFVYSGFSVEGIHGLLYLKNRFYSSAHGRFLTRDPLGYKVSLYTDTEAVTPFHLSYHRRRYLSTYPNNFHWLGEVLEDVKFGGVSAANRYLRRPAGLLRSGDVNLYSYAANDPINRGDPFGLDYLWVSGEYKTYTGGSGRYADLDVIWVEEFGEGDLKYARVSSFYNAVSGPWGNGPLPNGDYTGHTIRRRNDHRGMIIDGFGWSLNIDPRFNTTRDLLRIHPDGNIFGSLGCIAIDKEGYINLYDRLDAYIKENKTIDVHVRIRKPGGELEYDNDIDTYIGNRLDLIRKK